MAEPTSSSPPSEPLHSRLPATMRAAQFHRYGGPDVITVGTVPVPSPGPGPVLVRVAAVSLNGGEVLFRSGALRPLSGRRFPKGLGVDFAGTVVGIGEAVNGVTIGQDVWGLIDTMAFARCGAPAGSAAEYVVADADAVAPLPAGHSHAEAVALLAAVSTLRALRRETSLQPGERLLVRGGTGGMGYVGVQLGHAWGAHVTALVSAPKMELARDLGADVVLDHRLTKAGDLGEFDVILDTAGSNMLAFRRHLSASGRMVTLNFSPLLRGLAAVLVSSVYGRRRIRFFRGNPTRADLIDYARVIQETPLRALIGGIHDLDDVAGAHRMLQARVSHGKRVIRLHE